MLRINGKASRGFAPIVGEVTRENKPFYARSRFVQVTGQLGFGSLGYAGCVTSGGQGRFFHPDCVYEAREANLLSEGDIVSLGSDGDVSVLWEINSSQNSLLLTEACNCLCLMCPQPPQKHDPALLKQAEAILHLLRGKKVEALCVTGGEPTILGDKFLNMLARCVTEHPEASVNVLTNAKLFSDVDFTKEVAKIANKKTVFCVSMHSDVDSIHDHIVGKKGSYAETQTGVYNLARHGCLVEIRHVITRHNYKRLARFSEQMYSYFPFCAHYAFMGLEIHGNAIANFEEINVNPDEFKDQLEEAVLAMNRSKLNVSVYNLPLCLCSEKTRPFARKSISSWKNIFPSQCADCVERGNCAGFFGTSNQLPLQFLAPFKEETCAD